MPNRIDIQTWSIGDIRLRQNQLTTTQEYQRRDVWSDPDRSFLLNSIFNEAPIGVISLYRYHDEDGNESYEVVDGKQRLTTIQRYLNNELTPDDVDIQKILSKFDSPAAQLQRPEVKDKFHDKSFEDLGLDSAEQRSFLIYRVPIIIVEGNRHYAVGAFVRMNRQSYALSPQEVRNAVYMDNAVLTSAVNKAKELFDLDDDRGGALGSIGALDLKKLVRMHDVQILLELAMLQALGPQQRRDGIEVYLDTTPSADANSSLDWVGDVVRTIYGAIGPDLSLNDFGFPKQCENDLYAMVGAVHRVHGSEIPNESQMTNYISSWSSLRAEASAFVTYERTKKGRRPKVSSRAEKYGRTFLGGQQNSKTRREERIEILRRHM